MSQWLHDPLRDRTVCVAPNRSKRPSDFAAGGVAEACPFCAGSEHTTPPAVDQSTNDRGEWTARVVPNLFPIVEGDAGTHEVVIESRRHALRYRDLSDAEATSAWRVIFRRLRDLRRDERFNYVLMFKNEGRRAGASLEHVHSQLVAMPEPPSRIERMWQSLAGTPNTTDDTTTRGATLSSDDSWEVVAPIAPRTPCETWLLPRRGLRIDELATNAPAVSTFACMLRSVLEAINADDFNLVLQVAPMSMPSSLAGVFWLEVVPRPSAIAGFELATGAWINEFSPSDARRRLKGLRALSS